MLIGGLMEYLLPEDQSYRTCSECGGDTEVQPFAADGHIRIALVCNEHGLHSVITPFDKQ